jgi:hypothetical protein
MTLCSALHAQDLNRTLEWAVPSVAATRKLMRYVYEHRKEAAYVGELARESVLSKYKAKDVGATILSRLLVGGVAARGAPCDRFMRTHSLRA